MDTQLLDTFVKDLKRSPTFRQTVSILRKQLEDIANHIELQIQKASTNKQREPGMTGVLINEFDTRNDMIVTNPNDSNEDLVVTLFQGSTVWEGGNKNTDKKGSGIDLGVFVDYNITWPENIKQRKALGIQIKLIKSFEDDVITFSNHKDLVKEITNMDEYIGGNNSWVMVLPGQDQKKRIKLIKVSHLLQLMHSGVEIGSHIPTALYDKSNSLEKFLKNDIIGCLSGDTGERAFNMNAYFTDKEEKGKPLAQNSITFQLRNKNIQSNMQE